MWRRALQQNPASVYSERQHRANGHESDQDAGVRVDDVRWAHLEQAIGSDQREQVSESNQ